MMTFRLGGRTTVSCEMFKFRSISARLILAISLPIAATCVVLATFSVVQQRSLTRLALDYEGRAALAVSTVVASLPPVADAIVKGDREALVALTGNALVGQRESCLAAGMTDYPSKPFDAADFYDVIDRCDVASDVSGSSACTTV